MIPGLAKNGFTQESLALFEEMERTSTVTSNDLILLSVIFARSRCGSVDKGIFCFNSMEKVYSLKPSKRHYTSVVDLSRGGCISEPEKFVTNMPFEVVVVVGFR